MKCMSLICVGLKQLRQIGWRWVKSLVKLDKLMSDYDRLSKIFINSGFTCKLIFERFWQMDSKFDESMQRIKCWSFLSGQILVWRAVSLKNQSSWSWTTNQPLECETIAWLEELLSKLWQRPHRYPATVISWIKVATITLRFIILGSLRPSLVCQVKAKILRQKRKSNRKIAAQEGFVIAIQSVLQRRRPISLNNWKNGLGRPAGEIS